MTFTVHIVRSVLSAAVDNVGRRDCELCEQDGSVCGCRPSACVRLKSRVFLACAIFSYKANTAKLIPSDIKWDPNATPPQYTDNGDQVIEKGTHLRIKLIGTRSDVGSMFAIGSVKEDFLGFDIPCIHRWYC